jgi:hypothetical protein
MVSSNIFKCETCSYTTNRKYNLELHKRSPNACEKRIKQDEKNKFVENKQKSVENKHNLVENKRKRVENKHHLVENKQREMLIKYVDIPYTKGKYVCSKCNKQLSSKRNIENHFKICKGRVDVLQCHVCLEKFNNTTSKYRHIKAGNCIPLKDDKDSRIEELEKQLEERDKALEEEKQKRKEAEDSKSTINNITNNITNNTYFDHSINYNNYDNLSLEHISKEDIKRLYDNCKMQYPELSEDLTRMILSPKENQSIYLPEGQKSNTCTVMKDGTEMRKPLIRVLMSLGMQTAMLIHNSDAIEKNKKDILNNQFWADNRNACGLHICAVDELNEKDKEIVQRNKNIILDMCK